jgi:hypothetical protein
MEMNYWIIEFGCVYTNALFGKSRQSFASHIAAIRFARSKAASNSGASLSGRSVSSSASCMCGTAQ